MGASVDAPRARCLSRYPFLVLLGASRSGKTEFAKSLFQSPFEVKIGVLEHFTVWVMIPVPIGTAVLLWQLVVGSYDVVGVPIYCVFVACSDGGASACLSFVRGVGLTRSHRAWQL